MKKMSKIMIICMMIAITLSTIFFLNKDQKIYEETIKEKDNKILTLMLETEAGTGKYKENSSSFPQEGYYLNQQLSKCENGGEITWDENTKKINVTTATSDKCYAYFNQDKLGSLCQGENMAECFTRNYKKESSLIYHDGIADYEDMENKELEAGDLSYRYAGANNVVNNYVCFGGECSSNSSDEGYKNLYRIIGLFKNNDNKYEVKLIKADYATTDDLGTGGSSYGENGTYSDYANDFGGGYNTSYNLYKETNVNASKIGGYYWQQKGDCTTPYDWTTAQINTEHLNGYFWNNISSDWKNYVSPHDWLIKSTSLEKAAGLTTTTNAKIAYDYEVGENKTDKTTVTNNIGLMYLSDYYYAALPKNWTLSGWIKSATASPYGDYRDASNENWMFKGLYDWSISGTNNGRETLLIMYQGNTDDYCSGNHAFAARPVFYLKTTVSLQSGNGTKENPYRIVI